MWADSKMVEDARLQDFYSKSTLTTLTGLLDSAREKATSQGCPALDAADKVCIQRYVAYQDAGFMLSEMHCNAYLSALDRAVNHQHFARDTTSDFGTASSAILGLLKNATAATSVVTTTIGFAENSFKNYDEAYFPESRVRNSRGLFHKVRQQVLADFQARPPSSLAAAEFRINYFSNTCSPDWMRRLVDASVEEASGDSGAAASLAEAMGATPPKAAATVVTPGAPDPGQRK